MAKPFIDISELGSKELSRTLKELPAKMHKKVVAQAFTKGARVFQKAIQQALPSVSPGPYGTGTLARVGKNEKRVISRIGKRSRRFVSRFVSLPTREELGIPAGAKFYYPTVVEYGQHGKRPVAAKPYLRPAYDRVEPQVFTLLKKEIGKNIAKAWVKIKAKSSG